MCECMCLASSGDRLHVLDTMFDTMDVACMRTKVCLATNMTVPKTQHDSHGSDAAAYMDILTTGVTFCLLFP